MSTFAEITGNTSFKSPIGVTINELTGDVYVVDRHRIKKISPEGISDEKTTTCS